MADLLSALAKEALVSQAAQRETDRLAVGSAYENHDLMFPD